MILRAWHACNATTTLCEDQSAGHIHHSGEAYKALGHRDVGVSNAQTWLARRTGNLRSRYEDIVVSRLLAGTGLRGGGLDAHATHQCADVALPGVGAFKGRLVTQHVCAQEGAQQVQLVNATHAPDPPRCQAWEGNTPTPGLACAV